MRGDFDFNPEKILNKTLIFNTRWRNSNRHHDWCS